MTERHYAPHAHIPHPPGNTAADHGYSRGYLPHHQAPRRLQSITYRLADSLPRELLQQLLTRRPPITAPDKAREADYRKKLEGILNAGHGSSLLGHPAVAAEQVRIWKEDAPAHYDLIAFVVMPTHVHLLVALADGEKLGATVRRWKLRLNNAVRHLHANGQLNGLTPPHPIWHDEFHDRDIRDTTHLQYAINYIHQNPVKAGLCPCAEMWPWSSAFIPEEFPNH